MRRLETFKCSRRELNPHAVRHWFLRPACLPFHHSNVVALTRIERVSPYQAKRLTSIMNSFLSEIFRS